MLLRQDCIDEASASLQLVDPSNDSGGSVRREAAGRFSKGNQTISDRTLSPVPWKANCRSRFADRPSAK